MKFENAEVFNFESAIRGMRNPLSSWNKSDSGWGCYDGALSFCKGCDSKRAYSCPSRQFVIGENDLKLAQILIKSGTEHRKFMRQIFVSVDITAPLYWWKEFDTYKVGTTSNSCSTMHKLADTPITKECFEMGDFAENLDADNEDYWEHNIIWSLEYLRQRYIETKDKRYWKELIRLVPESWLQKRTITMSYENVLSMVKQRKNHKLTEWSVDFINWAKTLPYAKELLFIEG